MRWTLFQGQGQTNACVHPTAGMCRLFFLLSVCDPNSRVFAAINFPFLFFSVLLVVAGCVCFMSWWWLCRLVTAIVKERFFCVDVNGSWGGEVESFVILKVLCWDSWGLAYDFWYFTKIFKRWSTRLVNFWNKFNWRFELDFKTKLLNLWLKLLDFYILIRKMLDSTANALKLSSNHLHFHPLVKIPPFDSQKKAKFPSTITQQAMNTKSSKGIKNVKLASVLVWISCDENHAMLLLLL